MKKIMVLCVVFATAGSLYASKTGKTVTSERQFQNREIVKCTRDVELFPSLFFF